MPVSSRNICTKVEFLLTFYNYQCTHAYYWLRSCVKKFAHFFTKSPDGAILYFSRIFTVFKVTPFMNHCPSHKWLSINASLLGAGGGVSQEPAIPGFSVSITIPIPEKRSGQFRYRYRYQGWAKFDTDSDTDTKTLQML